MSAADVPSADQEALEYVLGLMDQDERKAFERDLLDDPDLAAAIWDWEERLSPMAEALPEKRAPAGSYKKISAKIFGDEIAQPKRRSTMARDLAYLFGTLATAAVAALVVVFTQLPAALNAPTVAEGSIFTAAIVDEGGGILLAVVDRDGAISVQPLINPPEGSAELWLVADGRDPISMGLLDAAGERPLTVADDLRALLSTAQFVVTSEPLGGALPGTAPGPAIGAGDLVEF